jgi:hypothetical protein
MESINDTIRPLPRLKHNLCNDTRARRNQLASKYLATHSHHRALNIRRRRAWRKVPCLHDTWTCDPLDRQAASLHDVELVVQVWARRRCIQYVLKTGFARELRILGTAWNERSRVVQSVQVVRPVRVHVASWELGLPAEFHGQGCGSASLLKRLSDSPSSRQASEWRCDLGSGLTLGMVALATPTLLAREGPLPGLRLPPAVGALWRRPRPKISFARVSFLRFSRSAKESQYAQVEGSWKESEMMT